jgi:hypothetical protein
MDRTPSKYRDKPALQLPNRFLSCMFFAKDTLPSKAARKKSADSTGSTPGLSWPRPNAFAVPSRHSRKTLSSPGQRNEDDAARAKLYAVLLAIPLTYFDKSQPLDLAC